MSQGEVLRRGEGAVGGGGEKQTREAPAAKFGTVQVRNGRHIHNVNFFWNYLGSLWVVF
jgi:hypothetical protein